MDRKLKARKQWIDTYLRLGSVSKAARRCGIPRSTLYRWVKRYEDAGEAGLKDISQRPKKLANLKISLELEELILQVRREKKFGPQRISTYLLREHKIKLSAPTIWRVLKRHHIKPLKRYKTSRKN